MTLLTRVRGWSHHLLSEPKAHPPNGGGCLWQPKQVVGWGWRLAGPYAGFVWWTAVTPAPPPAPSWFPGADKLAHLIEFIPLGYLLPRAVRKHRPGYSAYRLLGLTLLGTVALGLACELSQLWIPTRSWEVADLAADVLGGLIGWQLFYSQKHLQYG